MTKVARPVPSFLSYQPSSPIASKIKRHTRAAGGQAELRLAKELRKLGLKFRTHSNSLPGKPDIVFPHARVVVFCDGDFWHGRNWRNRRAKLAQGANAQYWLAKIGYNIKRDRHQTRLLENVGWVVIRMWETDIKANPEVAARKVARILNERERPIRPAGRGAKTHKPLYSNCAGSAGAKVN
jgi:DNA mismatch endonuclease (patch repair protein)